MTEKILLYHRLFWVCLYSLNIFLGISLLIFLRFKMYVSIQRWLEKQKRRDEWKQKKKLKKEKNNEQTIYMSNAETVELIGNPVVCYKRNSDQL